MPRSLSPDFEALTRRALDMTRPMLERFGGFFPFGLGVDRYGALVSVPVCDDEDQASGSLIEALRLSMRTAAVQRRFVASAVVYDATLAVRETKREFDVVAIELDDKHGRSIVSYVPYSGAGPDCAFGEFIVDPGEHEIFGDLPAAL